MFIVLCSAGFWRLIVLFSALVPLVLPMHIFQAVDILLGTAAVLSELSNQSGEVDYRWPHRYAVLSSTLV